MLFSLNSKTLKLGIQPKNNTTKQFLKDFFSSVSPPTPSAKQNLRDPSPVWVGGQDYLLRHRQYSRFTI